ncbi:hypothetical protein AVEN_174199-1 [Araneus ventricosus]|uniref:Uncharacterized protein n=1 Tax=Araneus ventricosus TaxID=182803 RepID=A0A4Y2WL22_ARAVE|nr:hypothetical protein AVEN_110237-1 [Araneus ventricosus]GBO37054.1 hypothetical protein AVEN_174199-1 [Araneus ventricosus]
MSVFEEEKLPSSFLHEVVSKSQDTVVLRSNVRNLEECGKWTLEFRGATKTKWNSRSSNPGGERFVCCLNTAETLKCLPSSACEYKFIDYFNDDMGTEACRYHKGILQLEKYKKEDMANSAIIPPYRDIQHWHDQWRLLNLGPRTC